MRFIYSFILFLQVLFSSAQDIEQLAKADPVAWSGGVTWSNIFTWPKDSARQEPTRKEKKRITNAYTRWGGISYADLSAARQ